MANKTSSSLTGGKYPLRLVDNGDGTFSLSVGLAAAAGGTQYTEGDADASITGTAAMWEDASDVLRPVSAAKPLPVNQIPLASTIDNVEAFLGARTTGGLTLARTISAASTNATSVKAAAGQVYWIYAHNINAAVRYLKLYNKASAPTVGTDTPVLTLPIPGNTAGAGFIFNSDTGLAFGTGIAWALTIGVADADTGAVAANEIVVNAGYK